MNKPLPSKLCAVCGRIMHWRHKWRRCWQAVRYCSAACQRGVGALDARLEKEILSLLATRGLGKTICPSEAVRAVFGRPQAWPDGAMERCRCAARRLAAAGELVVKQGGQVVDPSHAKGPIRLQKRGGDLHRPNPQH